MGHIVHFKNPDIYQDCYQVGQTIRFSLGNDSSIYVITKAFVDGLEIIPEELCESPERLNDNIKPNKQKKFQRVHGSHNGMSYPTNNWR